MSFNSKIHIENSKQNGQGFQWSNFVLMLFDCKIHGGCGCSYFWPMYINHLHILIRCYDVDSASLMYALFCKPKTEHGTAGVFDIEHVRKS